MDQVKTVIMAEIRSQEGRLKVVNSNIELNLTNLSRMRMEKDQLEESNARLRAYLEKIGD